MKLIIDVSEHNGTIDWNVVKPQIDGAILRCGYGGDTTSQDDKQYARNVAECLRLKIPIGVYLFSYAVNAQQAIDEAQHVLRLVKGLHLQLPIYYDIEYSAYVGDLSSAVYTQIVNAFCDTIEKAGGYVGVYANTSYWNTKLQNVDGYTRWIAQWGSVVSYDKPYKLWQYSSDGQVNGSSARTDVNRWYDDFLTMVGNANNFTDGTSTPPVNPTPSDPDTTYHVGDSVEFNALYTSSTSSQKITNIAVRSGKITKVITNAPNPYLINNGTGWVNDGVITTGVTPNPAPTPTYAIGDRVAFNALYTSSTSSQKITNIAIMEGKITKIIKGAPNPYLINNGTGWVNESVIIKGSGAIDTLQVGDYVRVRQGAKDYTGGSLASFVYATTYKVMEVKGSRVVIGNGTAVTAAVHVSDLYQV